MPAKRPFCKSRCGIVAPRARCYARPFVQPPDKRWTGGVEGQIELTADGLWGEVSSRLRGALNETTYRTWFGEARGAELGDDEFVVGVPNDFTREWIEGHFLGLIKAAVRDTIGHERIVRLEVSEALDLLQPTVRDDASPPRRPAQVEEQAAVAGLNPKYTFDLFVIG